MPEIESVAELVMVVSLTTLWFILFVTALYDLTRRKAVSGGKVLWGAVIVVFSLIGPLAYFIFGRRTSGDTAVPR